MSLELSCLKTDPMKNDLVLQRIFSFCDVPSLKSCRLVSSKWRYLSLKAWREKAVIRLGVRPDFGEFLEMIDSEDDDPFEIRKHPFKKYSLTFHECDPGDDGYWEQKRIATAISNWRAHFVQIIWRPYNFDEFNDFLSILNTNSLKHLEVNWLTFDNDVPDSIVPLKCSNLKRLSLFNRSIIADTTSDCSLWCYLLKSFFAKLESLSIGYAYNNEDDDETVDYFSICLRDRLGIVTLLKELRESGGGENPEVMPLRELEMINMYNKPNKLVDSGAEECSIVYALAECNFPLERLSIHVGWEGNNKTIPIFPILESCKDILQYLRASTNFNERRFISSYVAVEHAVKFKSDLKPMPCEVLRMEVLKEVHLLNGLEWAMFLLAHLELPRLQKLIVEYDEHRNHNKRSGLMSVYHQQGTLHDRLETFQLLDNFIIPGEKTVELFAKMMPNLAHLTMPLDKSTFQVICEHFKDLRTLHVLAAKSDYVEIDDEAIIGVSKKELEEGRELELQFSSRRPNLTDLKHLTDLSICCERQLLRNDVKLTEFSVIYGFLQLPRLYYLNVAIKEMSARTKKMLVNHVKGTVDFQIEPPKPKPGCFGIEIREYDDSPTDGDKGGNDSVSETELFEGN